MGVPGRRTVVVTIITTLLVLALASGVAAKVFYDRLNHNLGHGGLIDHVVAGPSQKDDGPRLPLNILVLGTDARDCTGCAIDGEHGKGGSDTTILLHVAADRRSAYGVSIPRDALVERPACTSASGKQIPAAKDVMWNSAYAIGGPACTARQAELLTGLTIDHYVALDFAGFKQMVDAVGGVSVCIPKEVDDTQHHIHLPAGTHTLQGDEALGYVRERFSTPNADLGRMRRQQYFISSLAAKVSSAGTLTRPQRLARFASSLSSSITTDVDGVSGLVGLALQLRHATGPKGLEFVTLPTVDFPRDSPQWGRLQVLPEAQDLWDRMRADRPLHGPASPGTSPARPPVGSATASPTGSPSGSPSTSPSASPSDTAEARSADAAANGLCDAAA